MKVVEKFVSINGEGARAGEPAVFVRFKGCNLRCSYCDTMWANEPDCSYTEMTPEEIREYVRETGIFNVTLTGGEPLLQKDMRELIRLLLEDSCRRIEIETNGAVDLAPFARDRAFLEGNPGLPSEERRLFFTMDYKLPASGSEEHMIAENLRLLGQGDTVKFVSGSRADLERAGEIIREYGLLGRCHVYFSPVFGAIEPVEIVDFLLKNRMNGARIQLQLHKVIWDPAARGV